MEDPEFHPLMIATAKTALNLYIFNLTYWFVSTRSSNTPFLVGSSTTIEVFFSDLEEFPGLCVLGHVTPPTNIWVVEVPQENQGL